jgi:hypothetical protein
MLSSVFRNGRCRSEGTVAVTDKVAKSQGSDGVQSRAQRARVSEEVFGTVVPLLQRAAAELSVELSYGESTA